MRYPTLTYSACERLADARVRGLEVAIEPDVAWLGTGEDLDLEPIEEAARLCIETAVVGMGRHVDRDQVEGALAARLWDAVQHVPTAVMDDPGFWRYLSIALFWDFIAWREEEPFENGNHLRYVDGSSSTEAVLPRMYLRASSVGGSDHGDLAAALTKATDFWRSHVIRVRTGTAPAVTREFVKSQESQRLTTDPLRELAKGINRTWTNAVPQLLDEEDAKNLIEQLRGSLIDGSQSD